ILTTTQGRFVRFITYISHHNAARISQVWKMKFPFFICGQYAVASLKLYVCAHQRFTQTIDDDSLEFLNLLDDQNLSSFSNFVFWMNNNRFTFQSIDQGLVRKNQLQSFFHSQTDSL